MKQTITCIQVNVEMSVFNEEGQLVTRPRVDPVVAFEVDIPEPVLQWLREQIAKRGA